MHGLVGSAGKSAYVAAKHGVVGLTKVCNRDAAFRLSLTDPSASVAQVTALETAKSNVTCNAICPGWVLTPLVQVAFVSLAHTHKPEVGS